MFASRGMVRSALLAVTVAMAGAAFAKNPWVSETTEQALALPPADKAQIVFLRPSGYFPSLMTSLYEVRPERDVPVSMIGGHQKVVYEVEPGRRVFLSNNGVGAHFLNADVAAGKRYYVLVRPIHGNGFQLRPLRKDGSTDYNARTPEFPQWLSETVRVEPAPGAPTPGGLFQKNMGRTRDKGFASWQEKTPEQIAELTLLDADGFESAEIAR